MQRVGKGVNRGRRKQDYARCFMGATIAQPTECSICHTQPIHPNPRRCGCSFWREGHLACRFCALGYDLLVKRSSKIPNPWTVEEIRDLLEMFDRGRRVLGVTRTNYYRG